MDIKSRILRESGELFAKNGIKNVTMDYISSDMGISKRTIYEIFKDKNDLVEQVITSGAKIHKEQCSKLIKESSNVIEAIFNMGKLNHETFGKINPMFFKDLKKYHFNIFTKLREEGSDFKDTGLTLELLKRGQKEGIFKAELNISAANLFVHEIFKMVHTDEFVVYGKEVLYESVFLPYLIGISTEKGREMIDLNIIKLKNEN